MPRMIKCTLIGVVAMAFTPLTAGSASAATLPSTCTPSGSPLTQAFLSWGDTSLYQVPSGESYDSFDGGGWTLSGGASITTTQLADGSIGQVLNLPAGATAISPTVCINSSYPTARTMMQNVVGGAGMFFYVSYPNSNGFRNTGQVHVNGSGWALANPANLQSNVVGWTPMQFEFVGAGGNGGDTQLYNFFLDPYCRG